MNIVLGRGWERLNSLLIPFKAKWALAAGPLLKQLYTVVFFFTPKLHLTPPSWVCLLRPFFQLLQPPLHHIWTRGWRQTLIIWKDSVGQLSSLLSKFWPFGASVGVSGGWAEKIGVHGAEGAWSVGWHNNPPPPKKASVWVGCRELCYFKPKTLCWVLRMFHQIMG